MAHLSWRFAPPSHTIAPPGLHVVRPSGEGRRKWERFALLCPALVLLVMALPSHAAAVSLSDTWTPSGSLRAPRAYQTATLLHNGLVLVAGGCTSTDCSFGLNHYPLASAELYNPATGAWHSTGSMHVPRILHTATLLPNGKVLVAGGSPCFPVICPGSSAELYDPSTGTWALTGSLHDGRAQHTATLLPNGKVLVTGGAAHCCYNLASAELYDPASGTWTLTGSMHTSRAQHAAALLSSGKVLVTGGCCGPYGYTAEVYDPASGTWTLTGSMNYDRSNPVATTLHSGKVLVIAGDLAGSAELYDPGTGTWALTGSLHTTRSQAPAVTLLRDGRVLVAGGCGIGSCATGSALSAVEIYTPSTGTWTTAASMSTPREYHTATLLPNGTVLAAGGCTTLCATILSSTEVYTP